MYRTLSLAALAAVLAATSAHAQVQAQPVQAQPVRAQPTATAGRSAVNDSLFAEAAAIGGMAELSLSEIGARRATDPQLKKFSQQMIDEHSRLNRELTELAARKRIPLPRTVDPRAQFCAQSLAGLSGEEFDRCYAKAQLIAHMDSAAAFEAEAERGMDPDVKALASRGLGHIKQHLSEIKPIAMKYEKDREPNVPTPGNPR